MDFRKYQSSLLRRFADERRTAGLYMVQVVNFTCRPDDGFAVEVPESMTESPGTLCVAAMRITRVLHGRVAGHFICECKEGNWYLDQNWSPKNNYMPCADPSAASEFVKSRLLSFQWIRPKPCVVDFIDLSLVLNW